MLYEFSVSIQDGFPKKPANPPFIPIVFCLAMANLAKMGYGEKGIPISGQPRSETRIVHYIPFSLSTLLN